MDLPREKPRLMKSNALPILIKPALTMGSHDCFARDCTIESTALVQDIIMIVPVLDGFLITAWCVSIARYGYWDARVRCLAAGSCDGCFGCVRVHLLMLLHRLTTTAPIAKRQLQAVTSHFVTRLVSSTYWSRPEYTFTTTRSSNDRPIHLCTASQTARFIVPS